MLFRFLFVFAAVAGALGQTTNTNSAINAIVSELDVAIHHNIPNILIIQANHTVSDGTIFAQVQQMISAFNTATAGLADTAVSAGSTTVKPTNDDISIVFSDVMQVVSSGLSGLTADVVPTFTPMILRLDDAVSATVLQLNTTLPGSTILVHRMMLDAQQFLVREGAWSQTLAALGF